MVNVSKLQGGYTMMSF